MVSITFSLDMPLETRDLNDLAALVVERVPGHTRIQGEESNLPQGLIVKSAISTQSAQNTEDEDNLQLSARPLRSSLRGIRSAHGRFS